MGTRWMSWPGVVAAVLAVSPRVRAAGVDSLVAQQMRALNTGPFDQELAHLADRAPGVHLPGIREIVSDLLHHQNPFPPGQLWQALLHAAIGDLTAEARVLGLIFLLSVLGAVMARLSEAFEGADKGGVAMVARMVVLSALILLALHSFGDALAEVDGLVGGLVHLMESMIPLLVVLMAGTGAIASAGIFHPLMLGTVNLVAVFTRNWVLPLVLLATVVELIGTWLPRFSLQNLALLLRQAGLVLLGGLMTLFLGVMAVEGAAGAVADGVTLRAGKFLANTFVPVVGKMFSDAMEAVLGSSMLLKNAVSLAGALGIIVLVAFPVLKLLVMMFLYRVGAAATQPLDVEGVTATLATMATALGWLVAIAGAVALMFFLVITVVMSVSNGVGL